jgi:hypothetical protein
MGEAVALRNGTAGRGVPTACLRACLLACLHGRNQPPTRSLSSAHSLTPACVLIFPRARTAAPASVRESSFVWKRFHSCEQGAAARSRWVIGWDAVMVLTRGFGGCVSCFGDAAGRSWFVSSRRPVLSSATLAALRRPRGLDRGRSIVALAKVAFGRLGGVLRRRATWRTGTGRSY